MDDNLSTISLLPYLGSGEAGFRLKPSLVSREPGRRGDDAFPFVVVSDASPLTRIIDARLESDDGSVIGRVFLLMEKDERGRTKNELWPLNNREIERWSRRAFQTPAVTRPDSVITLANQFREDGAAASFHPIFFCKSTRAFFHPPCPHCGGPLRLCMDDALLAESGLEAYSTSTRRYLYCPARASSRRGGPCFYGFSREAGRKNVKDRWALIDDLGRLAGSGDKARALPCAACPEREACFGPGGAAGSNIAPFSFYPFHMLIFRAPTIHAHDFLFLASGASIEDIEDYHGNTRPIGRMARLSALKRSLPRESPFLFEGEGRFFLEVLYLKLSFLGELGRRIFAHPDAFEFTDFGFSLEPVWVALADQAGLLPYYWNFKPCFIYPAAGFETPDFLPGSLPSYGLFFLGVVWFHALLVNKRQRVPDVHQAVTHALGRVDSTEREEIRDIIQGEFEGIFSPENIFWDPPRERGPIPPAYEKAWETALAHGLALLKAGMTREIPWEEDRFLRELDEIREDVKHFLFSDAPPSEAPFQMEGESEAIHDILVSIRGKWRTDPVFSPPAPSTDEEDEILETVILAPEHGGRKRGPPGLPGGPAPDELEETIVAPSRRTARPGRTLADRGDEEALLETVAISGKDGGGRRPAAPPPADPVEEDDIPETLILHPEPGTLNLEP